MLLREPSSPESGGRGNGIRKGSMPPFHIPFIRKDVDVPAARRENRGSVETVARILRFKALKEAAEEGKCTQIALAHHENDQAETILFHLLRGSGTKGMAGIQPRRNIFIRPFLAVTRKEIADFLSSFHVTPCHDETNDIPDATRNKIRLELMPRLLSFNPNLVTTLSREAQIFRDEEDFMEKKKKGKRSISKGKAPFLFSQGRDGMASIRP